MRLLKNPPFIQPLNGNLPVLSTTRTANHPAKVFMLLLVSPSCLYITAESANCIPIWMPDVTGFADRLDPARKSPAEAGRRIRIWTGPHPEANLKKAVRFFRHQQVLCVDLRVFMQPAIVEAENF